MGGSKIDAYCVLEPYEDRLSDKDNLVVPANDFLNQIRLLPQEEYWHIVAKSGGRFTLIRIEQRSVPLFTPKSVYTQKTCANEKSIVISKSGISTNKSQTVKIGK